MLLTPTMPVTAHKVGRVLPDSSDFGDDWIVCRLLQYP